MKISNSIVLLISMFGAQNLFAQMPTYGGSAAGLGLYGGAQACPYANPATAGMTKEDMQMQVLKNKIDGIKQKQDDMEAGYSDSRFSDEKLPFTRAARLAFVEILKSDRKEGKGGGEISCHRDPPAPAGEVIKNPATGQDFVDTSSGKKHEEKKVRSKKSSSDDDDDDATDDSSNDDDSKPGSNKSADVRNMEKHFSHEYCGDLDDGSKSDFYNVSSLHDICAGSKSIFSKSDKSHPIDRASAKERCDDFVSSYDRLERELRETEAKLKPLERKAEQKQIEKERKDDEDDLAGRPRRSMYTEAGVCTTCGYAPQAPQVSGKVLLATGLIDALSIGAWYKNAGREIHAGQELGYAPGYMGAPNANATAAYMYSLGRTGGMQGGSGSFGCSPQMGYAQGQNGLYGSAYGNVSPYGICGGAINSPCAGGQPGYGYPNGFNPYASGGIYPMGVGPGGASGPWGGNAGFYPNPLGVSQFPGNFAGAPGGPFANPMGAYPSAGGFPFPGQAGFPGAGQYPGAFPGQYPGAGYPGTFGGANPFGSAFGGAGGGPFANPMGGQFGGPSMFGGSPVGSIFGSPLGNYGPGLANPYAGGQFNQMGASPIALQQYLQQGWYSLQQEGMMMQQKAQYLYSLQNSLGYGGGSFASPYSSGYGQTPYGFGNYGGYNPYISQPGLSIGITAPLGGSGLPGTYGR